MAEQHVGSHTRRLTKLRPHCRAHRQAPVGGVGVERPLRSVYHSVEREHRRGPQILQPKSKITFFPHLLAPVKDPHIMFCGNCILVFQQPITIYPWYERSTDAEVKTLWKATFDYTITYGNFLLAAPKCHCCHEIWRYAESHQLCPNSAEVELRFIMKWVFDEDTFNDGQGYLRVEVRSSGDSDFGTLKFRTEMLHESETTRKQLEDYQLWLHNSPVTSATSANSTGSDYSARFVRKCMEDCKFHHKQCQRGPKGTLWYPTRLVEVQDDGDARLVETSETTPDGPYVTLSHCWGTSPIITTTTTNIDRFKKNIPLLDLPKTFRDAIQFTKRIGISLVWIDSLCIVQDSVKDWEFESRTMLQVYQHAECNITAADSEDSHGGLFRKRNHAIQPSGWFEVDNGFDKLKGFHCAMPDFYYKDVFRQQISSSRLMGRGWVYQERAASTRIIAFGQDQVLWDCSERLWSDVIPGLRIVQYQVLERDYDDMNNGLVRMAIPKQLSQAVPHTLSSLHEGYEAWRWIVRVYSSCAFTFDKDRPVAILGVAEMMRNALQDSPEALPATYWAGLWLQDIYRQLIWSVARKGVHRNNHVPSWSWLSIEGPVEWSWSGYIRGNVVVLVLATIAWPDLRAEACNSMFYDLSADLKIWCTLHPVQVTGSESLLAFQNPDMILTEHPLIEFQSAEFDCPDIETENLYFLPLTHTAEAGGYDRRSFVRGILVQPADNQPGTYRRCGAALHYFDDYENTKWVMDDKVKHRWRPVPEPPSWVIDLPQHEREEWVRRRHKLFRKTPRYVEFSYQKYGRKLGYLIHLV